MSKPIAAISTPNAAGGIGIVRISGDGCFEIAEKIFSPISGKKITKMKGYTAAFGHIRSSDRDIDEGVCLVFRKPHSYTGEDVIELSCHGGLYIVQQVLQAALQNGAEPAQPGEFTKRAYLNGRISLNEAEAVMNMIAAQGEAAAKAALNALEGALSKKIEEINHILIECSAQLGAWVDYPYDEIEELEPSVLAETLKFVRQELVSLCKRFDTGKAITEGVETAIVGKPNTGKSTIMNLLTGYERSIVTEIAGTTRDIVEQTVRVGNVVLHLSDTAGIHETKDVVESIGVNLAVKRLDRAQLAFIVIDGSEPLDEEDLKLIERCPYTKKIIIINKIDKKKVVLQESLKKYAKDIVYLSARTGEGRDELEKTICTVLGTADFDPSIAMLTTQRQKICVEKAKISIEEAIEALEQGMTLDAVNVCVDDAISSLLEITGQKASEAVVNEVFAKFCVGK